jgi:antitoxin MazE
MYLHLEIAMHVARWGNSLAVRIPAKTVKEMSLKEGDKVELGLKLIETANEPSKEELRAAAIERLLNLPRTLPADFKFDREEANQRR